MDKRDQGKVRLAVLTGLVLVIASLSMNLGEDYIRSRLDALKRKAYFENMISGKGLSLKEAKHWKPGQEREKKDTPMIK